MPEILKVNELKCGMVVCQVRPDGTPYTGPYNCIPVVDVQSTVVFLSRPFVAILPKGELSTFKRTNPKAEILSFQGEFTHVLSVERWSLPVAHNTEFALISETPA